MRMGNDRVTAAVRTTLAVMVAAVTLELVPSSTEVAAQEDLAPQLTDVWQTGQFKWTVSKPLLAVDAKHLPPSPENPWGAVKDPSLVRHDGRWHLFCSVRKQKGGQGRIRIGYLSFEDWPDAPTAKWQLLELTPDYHGAPQVFYFEPQNKWYLIYQAADESRELAYGPCYSTNDDLANPQGWTLPQPLYTVKAGDKAGLDFWVICDDTKAHLFFTTLNGQMWRAETRLEDFPNRGWTDPKVALEADIFEASHTYRLQGQQQYLSLIEAQNGGRRYYKAYLAEQLEGPWKPLAGSRDVPFASPENVVNQAASWTTSYSHGELIRTGINQRLEVDPGALRFVFQGASDEDRAGRDYGAIPWRLGILEPAN